MEKPTVTIRRASLEDNQLLAALGAKTFHDAFIQDNQPENIAAYIHSAFSPQKMAADLADPASVFFIAEVNGSPAGYAHLNAGQPAEGISGARPLVGSAVKSASSFSLTIIRSGLDLASLLLLRLTCMVTV